MNEKICESCGRDITKAVFLGESTIKEDDTMLRQSLVVLGRLIDRGTVLKPGEEHISAMAKAAFEAEKNSIFERIKGSCASHAEARCCAHGFILLSEQQREKRIKRILGEE